MIEEILLEMTKQIPNAVAVIVTVYIFTRSAEKQDATRTKNAAELEEKREKHELAVYTMWEMLFKQIIKKIDRNQTAVMGRLNEHEEAMNERYDKFQITKELLDAYKEKLEA